MTDYTELKRLADAANAVMGDVRVDVAITSESGPNQDEIDSVTAFLKLATPAAVMALIVENERLSVDEQEATGLCNRLSDLLRSTAIEVRGPEKPLKRHGFHDLPSRVKTVISERDQLQTENEALRKDAERYRGVRRVANRQGFTDEQFDQQTDARTANLDAAIGKGEQS